MQKIIGEIEQLTEEELKICKQAFNKAKTSPEAELKKLAKKVDWTDRNRREAQNITKEVQEKGVFKKRYDYHEDTDHEFSDSIVKDIITNPASIFETRNGEKIYYLKDGNIVIVDASRSGLGNVITAYGKSGVKGHSGAEALGGLATDPGETVTELMVIEGKIPMSKGRFHQPASKLYP